MEVNGLPPPNTTRPSGSGRYGIGHFIAAAVLLLRRGRLFCARFLFSLIVANCARNGAIYGCQNPTTAVDTSGIQASAQRDASNLNSQNLNVSSSTDSNSNPSTVSVTVTYPFSTITNYPVVGGTRTITRTVTMSVSPWTPN